ncbi:MAG: HD domain-containing phosphohydrolase, partial [Mycobacterium leprae]
VELSTVRVLAATVDAKDHYTRHHSTNVSFYARLLAQGMNLEPAEIRRIDLAGLLHDIGKIAVPDQVLQKPASLTPQERLLIQTHAAIGGNILAQAPYLGHLVALVRHHHEWYNGQGYPDGLSGDDIPLGAAILSLADAFDTMTSERVYRAAMPLDEAMGEIRRCSGAQFNPSVVEAWEEIVEQAKQRQEGWLLALGGAANPAVQAAAVEPLKGLADGPATVGRGQDPLDFLTDIRLIHRLDDLDAILSRAANAALHFWAGYTVQIYLRTPGQAGAMLAYNGGTSKGQRMISLCRQDPLSAVSRGLIGWVLETGQGANLPDAKRDPRWQYGDAFNETVSVLVTPIESGTEMVGVIQVVSPGESSFGRQDVKAIRIFAALLGEAIGNVRQNAGEERSERLAT